MSADVQISFRGMETSPATEAQVRHRVAELEHFSDRISACRVMLEATHRHQHQGNIYHVRVDLAVPGGRLVVNREPGLDHAHEDLHVAIRDAFDAARRRLQDHMRKLEGETRSPSPAPTGRIVRVFSERGYAFLVTDTGDEVYVHRNAVHGNRFDHLRAGDRVRYVLDPEEGDKGPQASAVFCLGERS